MEFEGADVNLYAYAFNNPTSYRDPSGENPLLVACVAGAATSAALDLLAGRKDPGELAGDALLGCLSGFGGLAAGRAFGALAGVLGRSLGKAVLTGGVGAIEDLLAGAREISRSQTTIQFERSDGIQEASRFFERIAEGLKISVRETARGPVRSVSLPEGSSVGVRPFSTGGRPTIQITAPDTPMIKARF